jgi:carboxylesterase type B
MYLGDDTTITGNAGLLDQQLGLKWINKNIGNFGGDPQRVTLFGESAGAVSATSHLLAKDSADLFQRIIAQSGSVFNPWGPCSNRVILENTKQLAARVGCNSSSLTEVEVCLKNVPAEQIEVVILLILGLILLSIAHFCGHSRTIHVIAHK